MTSSKSSERVSKAGEWRARPAELTTISILFLENKLGLVISYKNGKIEVVDIIKVFVIK